MAVTKAEVLIIVDQPNGRRFACGSNVILDEYNKGTMTPTEKDKRYDESAVKSPGSTDVPGVEPLDVTPDKIDTDERLASVLVHERAIASAAEPDSRKQLSFGPSEAVLPTPVRELLLDKPTPQLSDQERDEVPPPPPSMGKAKSCSFQTLTRNFLLDKKKLSKSPTKILCLY